MHERHDNVFEILGQPPRGCSALLDPAVRRHPERHRETAKRWRTYDAAQPASNGNGNGNGGATTCTIGHSNAAETITRDILLPGVDRVAVGPIVRQPNPWAATPPFYFAIGTHDGQQHGVTYEPAEKFKNDLYREFLPILNSGRAEFLDHPRLIAQLCALERRTARGGRESIDHPPNGHDDLANAVAGVLTLAGIEGSFLTWMRLVGDNGR
jgi:hypothetical protein